MTWTVEHTSSNGIWRFVFVCTCLYWGEGRQAWKLFIWYVLQRTAPSSVSTDTSSGEYIPKFTPSWLKKERVALEQMSHQLCIWRCVCLSLVQSWNAFFAQSPDHTPHLCPWACLNAGHSTMPSVVNVFIPQAKAEFVVLHKHICIFTWVCRSLYY